MAMLAEPRRKVRYTINPSGKDWFANGQSDGQSGGGQFGQRMLQNMGWREGQGLGKEGQGVAEPIRVKRKSDQRGVGCSGAYAAETMPQSVDFASLLSELNAAHGSSEGGGNDISAAPAAPPVVVSLEAKSRASKARLHYQKFTRGKDVSAYDSQSLACIFGSRALPQQSNNSSAGATGDSGPEADATAAVPRSHSDGCLLSPDDPDGSAKHGLQLVQSQTSLQDYFRVKMAELQQRRLQQQDQCRHPTPSDNAPVAEEEDRASWTSESSCSAASTAASKGAGEDCDVAAKGGDKKKKKKEKRRRVQFSLSPGPSPPPSPVPEPAEVSLAPETSLPSAPTPAEESQEDLVVIDFTLYPGSEFQRVLGYPLY